MSTRMLAEELAEIHGTFALCESQEVSVRFGDEKVYMGSPYDPELVEKVGRNGLGGAWKKTTKEWEFPLAKWNEVSAVYKAHYGTDGVAPDAKTRVHLMLFHVMANKLPLDDLADSGAGTQSVWFLGRRLATLDTRTPGAVPEPSTDVEVITGGFEVEGHGANAVIRFKGNTTLFVENMPMPAVLHEVMTYLSSRGKDYVGVTLSGFSSVAVGGGAGKASSGVSAAASASSAFDMDTLDASQKSRAKELETLLGAAAFRIANSHIPQGMVDKLLAANGLSRK